MATINISLPKKLKRESEKLVSRGYYVSFSDLVRSSLRKTLEVSKYDVWAEEAKEEYEKGITKTLKNSKDVRKLIARAKNA